MGCELVSVGVDYITASGTGADAFGEIAELGKYALWEERKAGNETRLWSQKGFQGYQCGSALAMAKDDTAVVKLSSHLAAELWPELTQHATNISRLDLETTFRFTPHQPKYARRCHALATRHKQGKKNAPELELRLNDTRGETLYVGRRLSDKYGRIYDKGRESKLPELKGCWRAELELHRGYAKETARQLLRSTEQQEDIHSIVYSHFKRHGILSISPTRGRGVRCARARRVLDAPVNIRLGWLAKQVRPTVEKLLAAGKRAEVLKALGLTEPGDPNESTEER